MAWAWDGNGAVGRAGLGFPVGGRLGPLAGLGAAGRLRGDRRGRLAAPLAGQEAGRPEGSGAAPLATPAARGEPALQWEPPRWNNNGYYIVSTEAANT